MRTINNIVLQGSFPGGRPYSSVLLQLKNEPFNPESKTQSAYNVNHSAKNIIQQKQANANVKGAIIQNTGSNRNNNAYQVNSSRLNLHSTGQPLPSEIKQKMEGVFNIDLSGIKIHTGPQAESIGALAFTTGNDIYFASGQYNPHTPYGQRILGHELTHVVQQRSGRVRNPFGRGVAVVSDPGMEAEADRMGLRAATAISGSTKAIQRKNNLNIITGRNEDPDSRVLSVLVDGKNAGSIEIRNAGADTAQFVNLHVDKNFRGIGAGQALVSAAKKVSKSMGKSKITLDSQDNGSGKLNSWYHKLGFTTIGVNEKGYAKMISLS